MAPPKGLTLSSSLVIIPRFPMTFPPRYRLGVVLVALIGSDAQVLPKPLRAWDFRKDF
jgi:hypothetical protein